jgi:transposase-like protein
LASGDVYRLKLATLVPTLAVEALKGDKTLAELAEKYELHPNQISDWRKQLMDNAEEAFADGKSDQVDSEGHIKVL